MTFSRCSKINVALPNSIPIYNPVISATPHLDLHTSTLSTSMACPSTASNPWTLDVEQKEVDGLLEHEVEEGNVVLIM